MLLLKQGQRSDTLHDVIFLSVAGCGIVNSGTRYRGRANLRSRYQVIKTAVENLRQSLVRADRNQLFGKTVELTKSVRQPLLIRNRSFVGVLDAKAGVSGKK